MSSDPEQEYFSDGMTEDLITDLSRLTGLFVIARNSVFTFKGRAVKAEQAGQELGVRSGRGERAQGQQPDSDHGTVDRRQHGLSRVG